MRVEDETPVSRSGLYGRPVPTPASFPSARASVTVQRGFDDKRPSWLDNPAFVPADVTTRGLAGSQTAVLDVNRPELGANFDAPDFGARADLAGDDEIDEPFDHRPGTARAGRRILARWRWFSHR